MFDSFLSLSSAQLLLPENPPNQHYFRHSLLPLPCFDFFGHSISLISYLQVVQQGLVCFKLLGHLRNRRKDRSHVGHMISLSICYMFGKYMNQLRLESNTSWGIQQKESRCILPGWGVGVSKNKQVFRHKD